jgi:hypothetical protein
MCSTRQRQHCEVVSIHVDRVYPYDDGREAETCQGYPGPFNGFFKENGPKILLLKFLILICYITLSNEANSAKSVSITFVLININLTF